MCKPPKKFSPLEWKAAIEACRPRLERDLAIVKPNLIFAVGAKALQVTTGKAKITPWYGTFLDSQYGPVFPSVHPTLVLRKPAFRPVFKRWLKTVLEFVSGKLKAWNWGPIVTSAPFGPGLAEVLSQAEQGAVVAIDIENNPTTEAIRCIGVGTAALAVSLPLEGDVNQADRELLEQIISTDCPKVFHNAQFDLLELKQAGFKVAGRVEDTLLLHAVVAPQLSHKLTDVAAFETYAPRWKTEFKVEGDDKGAKLKRFESASLSELLPYNARDVKATALLFRSLKAQVEKTHNGPALYEQYRTLDNLAMRMKERGVLLDKTKFDGHRVKFKSILEKAEKSFIDELKIPKEFKLGANGQHRSLNKLFFEVYGLQPFAFNEETGSPSLDGKTLQRFATENGGTSLSARTATQVLRFRKHAKLLSSYIDNMPSDPFDVTHPTWRAYGTRTGRWAANDPAAQTIPKGLRDLFCSRPGLYLAEADYSQLELRIVALLAGDKKLLEWYAAGEDVHTLNAKDIFQTSKPTKQQRDLAKRVVYGLNYGGSAETVWKSLLLDFPGLPFTAITKVVEGWFKYHPEVKEWQQKQLKLAEQRKYVEAPISGRRQYYHDGQIIPTEVLNFPIQSTAGDITNLAIIAVDKALNWPTEGVLFQVHDAIVIEGPDKNRLRDVLISCMEQEISLNGQKVRFKVDCKGGQNWGLLEEFH